MCGKALSPFEGGYSVEKLTMSQSWRSGIRAGGSQGQNLVSIDVERWLSSSDALKQHTDLEPREVACWSRSGEREITLGSRDELKRFKEPELNKSLDAGLDRIIPRDRMAGFGVEPLCHSLKHAGFDVAGEADIVTFRNNLNKIGGCPYNLGDAFEFEAVCVGNSVFLDVRRQEETPSPPWLQRLGYMGEKFETMCLEGVLESDAVNSNSGFCAAMKLNIGNHRIVLAAEISAEDNSEKFIDTKTNKVPVSDKDKDKLYLGKYQKIFLQSYLANVGRICIGKRDDRSGRLVAFDSVSTQSLHSKAVEWHSTRAENGGRGLKPCWDPSVCINFIEYVSGKVKKACRDNPGKSVRFEYQNASKTLVGYLDPAGDFASRIRATGVVGSGSLSESKVMS